MLKASSTLTRKAPGPIVRARIPLSFPTGTGSLDYPSCRIDFVVEKKGCVVAEPACVVDAANVTGETFFGCDLNCDGYDDSEASEPEETRDETA